MSGEGVSGVALVTLVAVVPLVVLMLTSFVKISVVLALLRNALGAPDAPSALVVMGVSLVLTFFVMAPVAIDMVRAADATAAPPTGQGASSPPRGAGAGAAGGSAAEAGDGGAAGSSGVAAGSGGVAAGSGGGAAGSGGGVAGSGGVAVGSGGVAAGSGGGVAGVAGGSAAEARNGPVAGSGGGADGSGSADGAPRAPLDVDGAIRRLLPEQYRGEIEAAERAREPLRAFLRKHAAERDRETFVALAERMGREVSGDELWVLAPAFLATELREAFAIAVLIFVPFLVIDLVVALGLAALGLSATQPQVVALPLKLLLFVAVDGWRLLLDSLLQGYV